MGNKDVSSASPAGRADSHPSRYPKHDDPDKGQVYGGECNRTACKARGAVYWNGGTYALYCQPCAWGINSSCGAEICTRTPYKPPAEEMDLAHQFYLLDCAALADRTERSEAPQPTQSQEAQDD